MIIDTGRYAAYSSLVGTMSAGDKRPVALDAMANYLNSRTAHIAVPTNLTRTLNYQKYGTLPGFDSTALSYPARFT